MLLIEVPQLNALLDSGPLAFRSWTFYLNALIAAAVLFFGSMIIGLVVAFTVPRLLNLAIKPNQAYCLYDFHYWVHRMIGRLTNIRFFTWLFGDSSYIVYYLRCLGYDLSRVVQTGSNFSMEVRHETPFHSTVGSRTMVAGGLSIINADFSSTSFQVSRASIGPRNFVGNNIAFPAQAKTGKDCLIATKAMIPIDGQVWEGVGLLGSPCIEIPRSVERDSKFDHLKHGDELRRRLKAKNKHNLVSIGGYLLVRWIYLYGVALIASAGADLYHSWGEVVIALASFLILLCSVLYFVLVERLVTHFRPLRPLFCSIYDVPFWRHERFWKVPVVEYIQLFNGTPFKNMIWRLLGVRLGKRVCSATHRRTAPSSVIKSRSVPVAPSVSDLLSTTARRLVTARSSPPIPIL